MDGASWRGLAERYKGSEKLKVICPLCELKGKVCLKYLFI